MQDPEDRRALGDEIVALERRRLRALVSGDIATAGALHAVEYQLVTPGGGVLDRDGYLGMIERGEFTYDVFEPASEVAIRVHADVVALRYRARIEAHWDDNIDRGTFWHTDLWERRDGTWQAVWSQATRIRETG